MAREQRTSREETQESVWKEFSDNQFVRDRSASLPRTLVRILLIMSHTSESHRDVAAQACGFSLEMHDRSDSTQLPKTLLR